MDDKFKVCSIIFSQIYTIHVLINHQVFPCVFAPLPSKAEATYNRFPTEILTSVRNIGNEPGDMLVNFERTTSKGKYFILKSITSLDFECARYFYFFVTVFVFFLCKQHLISNIRSYSQGTESFHIANNKK